eukprot:2077957-Pyramimonas_sp.AAC.1
MPPAMICALSWTPPSGTPPRVGCFCLYGLFLPPGGAFGSQECRKRIWGESLLQLGPGGGGGSDLERLWIHPPAWPMFLGSQVGFRSPAASRLGSSQ